MSETIDAPYATQLLLAEKRITRLQQQLRDMEQMRDEAGRRYIAQVQECTDKDRRIAELEAALREIEEQVPKTIHDVPEELFQSNYEPDTRQWLAIKKAMMAVFIQCAEIARRAREGEGK